MLFIMMLLAHRVYSVGCSSFSSVLRSYGELMVFYGLSHELIMCGDICFQISHDLVFLGGQKPSQMFLINMATTILVPLNFLYWISP